MSHFDPAGLQAPFRPQYVGESLNADNDFEGRIEKLDGFY